MLDYPVFPKHAEIPEFVLKDLFDDKKYKIGSLKDDESYFEDENSKAFKKKFDRQSFFFNLITFP